jgi:murein L,D-transpeptidase YafK
MKKLDLSKMTDKVFKNIFNSVTEKQMNSEKAKKIKIEKSDTKLTINFDIDCNRYGYWKNNMVQINNSGDISIRLSDCPVQGAIEGHLKIKLYEFLKQN